MSSTTKKDTIKSSVSIVDVADHLELRVKSKIGDERQLHCPFHGEDRHASARMYLKTNSIFCFTCHKSWDVIDLIKNKKDLSFNGAMDYLARTFNVKIEAPHKVKKETVNYEDINFQEFAVLVEGNLVKIKKKVPFEKYILMCNYFDRICYLDKYEPVPELKKHLLKFREKIQNYDN